VPILLRERPASRRTAGRPGSRRRSRAPGTGAEARSRARGPRIRRRSEPDNLALIMAAHQFAGDLSDQDQRGSTQAGELNLAEVVKLESVEFHLKSFLSESFYLKRMATPYRAKVRPEAAGSLPTVRDAVRSSSRPPSRPREGLRLGRHIAVHDAEKAAELCLVGGRETRGNPSL
jgi:hypothetical protein